MEVSVVANTMLLSSPQLAPRGTTLGRPDRQPPVRRRRRLSSDRLRQRIQSTVCLRKRTGWRAFVRRRWLGVELIDCRTASGRVPDLPDRQESDCLARSRCRDRRPARPAAVRPAESPRNRGASTLSGFGGAPPNQIAIRRSTAPQRSSAKCRDRNASERRRGRCAAAANVVRRAGDEFLQLDTARRR